MKRHKDSVTRDVGVVSFLAIMVSKCPLIDVKVDHQDVIVTFRKVDKDLLERVRRSADKYFTGFGDLS